jgi:hypothetical protein
MAYFKGNKQLPRTNPSIAQNVAMDINAKYRDQGASEDVFSYLLSAINVNISVNSAPLHTPNAELSPGSFRRASNSGPSCDAGCIGGLIAGCLIIAVLLAYGLSRFFRAVAEKSEEKQLSDKKKKKKAPPPLPVEPERPFTLTAEVLPLPVSVQSPTPDTDIKKKRQGAANVVNEDDEKEPAWTGQFGEAIRPRVPTRSALRQPSVSLPPDYAAVMPLWNPDAAGAQSLTATQTIQPGPLDWFPTPGPAASVQLRPPSPIRYPIPGHDPLYVASDGFGGSLLRSSASPQRQLRFSELTSPRQLHYGEVLTSPRYVMSDPWPPVPQPNWRPALGV